MSLQNLIEQNLLKKIENIPLRQTRQRFNIGVSYLNLAEKNLDDKGEDENYSRIIYTNIYDAARIVGEAFLLLIWI